MFRSLPAPEYLSWIVLAKPTLMREREANRNVMDETNQNLLGAGGSEAGRTFFEYVQTVLQHPLFTVGATPITLLSIINLLLMLGAVLLVSRLIRLYFLANILKRSRLQPSIQYAVGKVAGYLTIALGFYIALQTVGIDLSALAVVAGAIGVGIGFGLQNIINNFVSGLIILAERPITIGDRVEVAGVAGQVQQINLRSTMVLTNDNISIIVPNSEFITATVVNWSHGDPKVRMRLSFGVAYGSDLDKMRRVVAEMAARHPKVMREPHPEVFFTGFGDSSLDFELVVWTSEATFSPRRFRSDLFYGLEKVLREHQLEIPFPQRDLHLRSGKLIVENQSNGKATGRLES
jgi:small-conductance mechanosensitive channel